MADRPMSTSNFLVRELRHARSAAGLSQEDLGKAINYSSSLISAVEKGQRPPTEEYLALVDRALGTGGLFGRLLKEVVSLDWAPVWLRDWIVLEREATLIRWFEPSLVPGLLQTEAYARAVLGWGGLMDAAEVEQRVASRLERQEILARPKPPQFVAIIDESVLHRPVGGAAVMAEQCERLIADAQRPHIAVHILPVAAGGHAGLAGGFIIAKSDDMQVAHVDNSVHAQVIEKRDVLDSLIPKWEALRGEALPRGQSIELIRDVAKTWQS